jgi:hypothetical protein
MPSINPDRPESSQLLPVHCVTALFVSKDAVPRAIEALRAAGFKDAQIQIFIGEEGVRQLFIEPDQQSVIAKFFQALTEALADDASYLDSARTVLKNGGAMISVHVGDVEASALRATNALKSVGGAEVQHWGQWRTEQL